MRVLSPAPLALGCALAGALLACASGPEPVPQVSVSPALVCGPPPPAAQPSPPVAGKPPVAGQPTEAMQAANRSFEAEKWAESLPALDRVASGQTGDDEGNKQIAEYHAAIARYRLKDIATSGPAFVRIGRNPDHLKHQEALLWLLKLDNSGQQPFDLNLMAFYDEKAIARFDNGPQRDLFGQAAYLRGRYLYQHGEIDRAAALFERIHPRSTYHDAGASCMRQITDQQERERKAREEQERRAAAAASAALAASASARPPASGPAGTPTMH